MIKAIERRIKFNSTSEITRKRHLSRIEFILSNLTSRFGLKHSNQIQLKHIRWCTDVLIQDKSELTKSDYIRSLKILIQALGRDYWLGHLGLSAHKKHGGRPTKIRIAHTRNRH